jgi:aminocarboxymuconate-semialdehyde decarboxylase
MMDEVGIDLTVLSAGQHQPYFAKPEDALAGARLANDTYAGVAKAYPGRFAAFGCVPLPHVGAAIEEAGRCLETLGMVGLTTGTSVMGRPLDDPEFEPFFAELDRRGAALFLHPCGVGGPMMNDFNLTWSLGACFEDAVTSMRLVQSGLTTRHPNIKIIVPHLGGVLPFLAARIDHNVERQIIRGEQPDRRPSEALKDLYFDTVNDNPLALRCACEAFGTDRLLLGTDYPFIPFKHCVTYIQESGLPQATIDQILDQNAQRVLGL